MPLQLLAAVLLDLALGDPQWLPHPVRGIGWLATTVEWIARRTLGSGRLAGLLAALTVYAVVGGAAWGAIGLAERCAPWAGQALGVLLIYTSIAARDLARHSSRVFQALDAGDLAEARRRVGMIVGRDTHALSAAEVVRAAVESVAESTVDGVTAPLFYAALCGPVGAIVYRAVNTLDSMFGHRDDRYLTFGWAAARIDDAANYLPARLTGPLLCLAALILRQRPQHALRILVRDARNHASPNAGYAEAAMAGALGVQVGGVNYYDGEPIARPTIGEPLVGLAARHIRLANALMYVTSGLFLAACVALQLGAMHAWQWWRAGG